MFLFQIYVTIIKPLSTGEKQVVYISYFISSYQEMHNFNQDFIFEFPHITCEQNDVFLLFLVLLSK